MLMYHIKAIHPELNVYDCPHCREQADRLKARDFQDQEENMFPPVEFSDLEFHLRCHGTSFVF